MSLLSPTEMARTIQDLTYCAICLESFTRPKVLPCQHTYCYSCLLSLCPDEKQTKITCPECREIHDIPDGGISKFRDNIMANSLLQVSAVREEVMCFDCELKPSVSVCEHCNADICSPCLHEHIKLSTELKISLQDVAENMALPKSDKKKEGLKTSVGEWRKQFNVLKDLRLQKLQHLAQLYQDSSSLENFMEIIGRVYDDLSLGPEELDDSYCAFLSQKMDKCTTIQSLKDLKCSVSDLKNIVRLVENMDDHFRFVPAQDENVLGQIEFGQAVVNVRGKYQSDMNADEILKIFPGHGKTFEQTEYFTSGHQSSMATSSAQHSNQQTEEAAVNIDGDQAESVCWDDDAAFETEGETDGSTLLRQQPTAISAEASVGIKSEAVEMKKRLTVDPNDVLCFTGPFTDVVTSYLKLSNPSDRRVYFTVMTTAPKSYCVRPNRVLLEPGSSVKVAIQLKPFDYDPQGEYNHKFMVRTKYAPDDSSANVEKLFKECPTENLMDCKILCVFDMPAD